MADLSEQKSQEDPLQRLREIVARLRAPGGCPWDREQTHATLGPSLVEEAYEVVEAIESGTDAELCDELGDLLLQVVMHTQIASETGRFTLEDAARMNGEKLIRRHPHVFGDDEAKLADSAAVLQKWDEIKRAEKGNHESLLDGVSRGMPALLRAEKIQKRVSRVGFDWPEAAGALAKLREESDEVAAAAIAGDPEQFAEELGDLLFAAVNVARKHHLTAELLLQQASDKFTRRFHQLEARFRAEGRLLTGQTLEALDEVWDAVKASER